MSKAEIPTNWEALLDLGRRSGTSDAFMEQLRGLSETTDQTVYRDFLGNEQLCLPGVGQTPAYMRGVFLESGAQLDEETTRQKVAMRLGVWSLFLDSGGTLEAVMDKRALTHRPPGVNKAAMVQALDWTLRMADHPQVGIRILRDGPFAEQTHEGFGLAYMHGVDAGHVSGDRTPKGTPSVVLVDTSDVPALEQAWRTVDAAALDVDESFLQIEAALHDLQKPA